METLGRPREWIWIPSGALSLCHVLWPKISPQTQAKYLEKVYIIGHLGHWTKNLRMYLGANPRPILWKVCRRFIGTGRFIGVLTSRHLFELMVHFSLQTHLHNYTVWLNGGLWLLMLTYFPKECFSSHKDDKNHLHFLIFKLKKIFKVLFYLKLFIKLNIDVVYKRSLSFLLVSCVLYLVGL